MQPHFDFISIGDTVTDNFIELNDARIDTRPDPEDRGYDELSLRFGDKVPYQESVTIPAVGNASNAAVSAARLGLKTAFVTDIGDDELGREDVKALKENNVDCRWVEVHAGMKSNYHYVLQYKVDRTILIKHYRYPYSLPKDLEAPKWIYFSSVGEHGLEYHHEIARWLEAHPETKLAFQPGTFQINFGVEKIKDVYKETDVLFCNKNEARLILNTSEEDVVKLLKALRALGPEMTVVTDGVNGAYAYDGNEIWFVPMYPDPKPPVGRIGAGDAFSSTFTAVLAMGKPWQTALMWAPVNSMSVTQYFGAREGLLSREKLEEYLANAPEHYQAQKIA